VTIEKLMEVYVERGKKERLRDEFAMAALTGLLAKYGLGEAEPESMAADSYAYADAMLRAREVKP